VPGAGCPLGVAWRGGGWGEGRSRPSHVAAAPVNLNLKMLLHLAPQKFTTFTTFTTIAKFAKFANITSTLDHPTPLHRHPPRLQSILERAVPPQNPPLPARRAGYPRSGWRAGGEGCPG
jgi:hypothetical protein